MMGKRRELERFYARHLAACEAAGVTPLSQAQLAALMLRLLDGCGAAVHGKQAA